MARDQGKQAMGARLIGILAYIVELETKLDVIDERRRHAGYARAESLTPERRREIATMAGRRLKAVTSQTDPLPL